MSDNTNASVVIIGAGQAADSTAFRLRKNGFPGPVTIIGDEPAPPYQRPPLSKKYLTGEHSEEKLYLRSQDAYAEHDISLCLGVRADAIDRQAKAIRLSDGRAMSYRKLILATGARPRLLPDDIAQGFGNIHCFRTLEDARQLRGRLDGIRSLCIIGGGYVGLEMAAVAAGFGLQVTLVEMADRILQRVAAEQTSEFFRNLHKSNGVDLREGVALKRLEGEGRSATLVHLSDGSTVTTDLLVVGIGVLPNDELANDAGLTTRSGVVVNENCRTSDADIFAVGDCAAFPRAGELVRIESVPNAIGQGEHVADVICNATSATYSTVPWFWSDQYNVKLQIAGLNASADHSVVRDGSRPGGQSVWYFKTGRLIAVDAMNDARAYMLGKRWIEQGVSPAPAEIASSNIKLTDVAVCGTKETA